MGWAESSGYLLPGSDPITAPPWGTFHCSSLELSNLDLLEAVQEHVQGCHVIAAPVSLHSRVVIQPWAFQILI